MNRIPRWLVVSLSAALAGVSLSCGDEAEAPSWYADRRELPTCGVDEAYGENDPDRGARECFQDAFRADEPAELTRLEYGDEGESTRAHFRVLGEGRYEIVGEQLPSPATDSGGNGWVRYQCERFEFIDDPSSEVHLAPQLNADGECELIDHVDL